MGRPRIKREDGCVGTLIWAIRLSPSLRPSSHFAPSGYIVFPAFLASSVAQTLPSRLALSCPSCRCLLLAIGCYIEQGVVLKVGVMLDARSSPNQETVTGLCPTHSSF